MTFIKGVPTASEVLDQVKGLLKKWNATTVMISEDSAHAYQMVLDNMRAYWPIVSVGSCMLVQDTKMTRFVKRRECGKLNTTAEQDKCWDDFMQYGPGDALKTFMSENNNFEVDSSREYLLYTQHAGGFLKHVR